MKFALIIFAALTEVALGDADPFNPFEDTDPFDNGINNGDFNPFAEEGDDGPPNFNPFGGDDEEFDFGPPPSTEDTEDEPFGPGATGNEEGFTGTDFRCTAMGGVCLTRLPGTPTCCPNGWTASKTCDGDKWCCRRPARCERNNGGRCINTDTDYCPGTVVAYHADYSCPGGNPMNSRRCCKKDSPCEKQPNGYCVKSVGECKGTIMGGLAPGYCGTDASYLCCIRDPVPACTNPGKGLFCELLDNPPLAISSVPHSGITALESLEKMCDDGDVPLPPSCENEEACLRKAIPSYLECVAADCPGAEIMSFTVVPDMGFNLGFGNPQCKGKVVGLKIDASPPTTCDIDSVKEICFAYHGTGYDFEIPPGSNMYYIYCVFP